MHCNDLLNFNKYVIYKQHSFNNETAIAQKRQFKLSDVTGSNFCKHKWQRKTFFTDSLWKKRASHSYDQGLF